jgi:hypothetical protein
MKSLIAFLVLSSALYVGAAQACNNATLTGTVFAAVEKTASMRGPTT